MRSEDEHDRLPQKFRAAFYASLRTIKSVMSVGLAVVTRSGSLTVNEIVDWVKTPVRFETLLDVSGMRRRGHTTVVIVNGLPLDFSPMFGILEPSNA